MLTLGKDAAHHARVRRLEPGIRIRLVDGVGGVGAGTLVRMAKSYLTVKLSETSSVDPPPPVHLLVPVADRDRMLWLAEKCAELGVTSWRPVLWRRSRSVSPRGEGAGFQQRVRARMIAALEQSGGAWLPMLYPDAKPEHAMAATPAEGARILLSPAGAPLLAAEHRAPVSIALGPEGGFEQEEVDALVAAGFEAASFAGSVLRFETAGIAAVAIVRASLALTGVNANAR
jgi:16S rRNA (uracil1498-N3)-methyltransferase